MGGYIGAFGKGIISCRYYLFHYPFDNDDLLNRIAKGGHCQIKRSCAH
jgi:hypothetical protein